MRMLLLASAVCASLTVVATAQPAPLEPKLNTFREFRRRFLLLNKYGRKFVENYNKYGPSAAHWIAERDWARSVARVGLWPLYGFAYLSLKWGILKASLLALALLLSLASGVVGAFSIRSNRKSV